MKPGHEFDTYGRGWALSGGSCVSRTIRGLPDEIRNFEINEDHLGVVINLKNYREFCDKMRDKDNYNYQSDLFNVVLPNGRSIDFVIQGDKYKNLTYKLSDADKDVKIKCNYITTSINSFVITDESGIIYEFMIADKASNGYLQDRLYNNVTWLLTKVILTNGRTINYEYNDVEQIKHDEYNDLPIRTFNEPCITFGYVFYVPDEQKEAPYWTKFTTTKNCPIYYEHLLNRIRFGNANINFNYSQASTTNDLITDIVIADGYGASRDVVRKIEFDVNTSLRQLRKLSILGTGRDTLNYSFKYSSQNPGTCTDHWGNYCGGTSTDVGNFNFFIHKVWGGNYVPEQYFPHYVHSLMTMMDKTEEDKAKNDYTYKFKLQHASWNYDSRSPSSPNCHGVLTSITYPNGGHTVFDYENHSFLTASMEDGSMEFERRRQRVVDGGGFRIKSISNYSADGALTDNYEYCYGPTYGEIRESKFPFPNDSLKSDFQHTGCGEAVVDPNLLTYMNYDLTAATPQCFKEMLLGIRVDRNQPNFTNYIASDAWGIVDWWYECRFSAQNFRNLLGGRPAVVYPEITVYHGKMIGNTDPLSVSNSIIGKTVYKFDVYSYTSRQTYQNQFYHKWAPDTTYFERVYYLENALHAEEHKARRNRLLSVTEYGRDRITDKDMFRELSKEKYEYKDNENTFSSGFVYNNRYNLEHQISPQGAFDYYISQGEQENQYQNPYSRPSSKPENYMPHSP
ncbi:MAG: hypothetical protein IKR18_09865, partial [Bacteroidaceae bacterium]|nr:hypothetical protein [Bacteroidaceae bacterium]